jgi:trans-aconitate methyltransferase
MNITQEYTEQLKKLHEKKSFGVGAKIPGGVVECIENYQITSLLDFGCGKGLTLEAVKNQYPNIACFGYDPAREGYTSMPDNVDLIYSSDVLEHIEPHLLDQTLNELYQKANKVMYHLIACHPAKKRLDDGRNAHLIVESPDWWRSKLQSLGWKIVKEKTKEYTTQPKKGPPIHAIKYIVVIEK